MDLGRVNGAGPKGRITPDDVKAFVKRILSAGVPAAAAGAALPRVPEVDFSKFGEIEAKPLGRIQKISGPRLQASWLNVPHVWQMDEADITELEDARTKLKGKAQYVVAKEGGEIWIDYYNIPVGAANPEAAHAWMDFVYQPRIAGLETSYTYYGSPLKRSLLKGTAAGPLLTDKVVFPPPATVKKLELNTVTATGKRLRERIWTEFKAS